MEINVIGGALYTQDGKTEKYSLGGNKNGKI